MALGDIHLRFAWRLAGCVLGVALGDIYLFFHVAGVALGDIYLRFAWQAWHLGHWARSGGALGARLAAGDAAALCVAGMALGDIHLRFTWQAGHLPTFTFVLRGRRPAGVALMVLGSIWWRAWGAISRQ